MFITRTPYRVSLIGGGCDHGAWYRHHGARILTSSIAHYCYLSARWLPPFHGHKHRIVWSKIEQPDRVEDIEHPAVRACLQYFGIERGIEIHHTGDLPARSGLGSSSAFTVGLLHALASLQGIHMSHGELADAAIHVEQVRLKEAVGIQDQIECAHGDLRLISIGRDGQYVAAPLALPLSRVLELERSLMLFYTGTQRYASSITAEQVAAITEHDLELATMAEMVGEGVGILAGGAPLEAFGLLLGEAWMLKRRRAGATSPEIDRMYTLAVAGGAIGGRLLGAGGGGFMLLFVRPPAQADVRAVLSEYVEVPFRFDHHGTQLIVAEPGRRVGPEPMGALPLLQHDRGLPSRIFGRSSGDISRL